MGDLCSLSVPIFCNACNVLSLSLSRSCCFSFSRWIFYADTFRYSSSEHEHCSCSMTALVHSSTERSQQNDRFVIDSSMLCQSWFVSIACYQTYYVRFWCVWTIAQMLSIFNAQWCEYVGCVFDEWAVSGEREEQLSVRSKYWMIETVW